MKLVTRFLLAILALSVVPARAQSKGDYIAYIGTYTRPNKSKGIYAWRFNAATGKLSPIGLVGETVSPSFLAVHPNHKFLYAVNEVGNYKGEKAGSVTSFSLDAKTGMLKALNTVSTKGDGPCHLAIDPTGKWLIVANYGGGSVAEYPVHADGSLGEASAFVQHEGSSVDPARQKGPHAHATVISPDGKLVFVNDLGLDKILAYRVDGLKPADPPFAKVAPGAGPRHLAFSPNGRFAYAITEMTASVVAFRYSAGKFEELQSLPNLAEDVAGKSGAEIAVHPSGKFVYASTRGANLITLFAVDPAKGTLTAIDRTSTQGKTPRNFAIDPTGAYLFAANQDSDNVVVFKIDQKTGKLTASGETLEAGNPVCVIFVPAP
jgi:6-phosphogluconolactonase